MVKSANVLGTVYKIEIHKISEDNDLKENGWAGYCNGSLKLIVVADVNGDESVITEPIYRHRFLRKRGYFPFRKKLMTAEIPITLFGMFLLTVVFPLMVTILS